MLLHIDLPLKIIPKKILFLHRHFFFYFGFLFSVPFVAVTSLHFLAQVWISILTVVFCYSVGVFLILSDLFSLFFSWHSVLVLFLPSDLHDSFSLWICCLLYCVCCLWSLLFSMYLFAIYLCYYFNLLNLLLWYCSSLGISWV